MTLLLPLLVVTAMAATPVAVPTGVFAFPVHGYPVSEWAARGPP